MYKRKVKGDWTQGGEGGDEKMETEVGVLWPQTQDEGSPRSGQGTDAPQPPGGGWSHQHLNFGHLPSRTVKE